MSVNQRQKMIFNIAVVLIILTSSSLAVYLDYEEASKPTTGLLEPKTKRDSALVTRSAALTEEYEPVTFLERSKEAMRNIDCENFNLYSEQCSSKAQEIFNLTAKAPPVPGKIVDWCSAMKYLVSCTENWNIECKDFTENRFNEESIAGEKYVIQNICENTTFLAEFMVVSPCLKNVSDNWQFCFLAFSVAVDSLKNASRDWHHYETHFFLCCERAKFRKCTLQALFELSSCTRQQAMALQKFSIILSEGIINQPCGDNIKYDNCPGGDPRPTKRQLSRLVSNQGEVGKFPDTPSRRSGSVASNEFAEDTSAEENRPSIMLMFLTQICPRLLITLLMLKTAHGTPDFN